MDRLRDGVCLVTGSTGLAAAASAPRVAGSVASFGRIDGLFAVVGGSGRRFGDRPIDELTPEDSERTLASFREVERVTTELGTWAGESEAAIPGAESAGLA